MRILRGIGLQRRHGLIRSGRSLGSVFRSRLRPLRAGFRLPHGLRPERNPLTPAYLPSEIIKRDCLPSDGDSLFGGSPAFRQYSPGALTP
jgi:hypothetical protein